MPVERFNDDDLIPEEQAEFQLAIKDICEKFETDEEICNQERYSLMTKVQTFIQIYKSKVSIYNDMEELGPETTKQYAEDKSMLDFFEGLFQDIHSLDGRRIKQESRLCDMVTMSNANQYVTSKIKKYEY